MFHSGVWGVVFNKIVLITLLLFFFAACSSAPDNTVTLDGEMSLELELEEGAAVKFKNGVACRSCIPSFKTQATANVQEFQDSWQLDFTDFSATLIEGPGWGVVIDLNPEMKSEGVISKFDDNGEVITNHKLTFHLRAQFAGQVVNFNNVTLFGLGGKATLNTWVEGRPVTTSDNQAATLQITAMRKDLDTGQIAIVDPCGDCPCEFHNIPMTDLCWVVEGKEPSYDTSTGTSGGVCTLKDEEALAAFQVNNDQPPELQPFCLIGISPGSQCTKKPSPTPNPLNSDQLTACACRLKDYVSALNSSLMLQDGPSAVNPAPPYECDPNP